MLFTSIVVGTDGSVPAREAVRVAAEMARQFGAQLHIVSAYRVFGDMFVISPGQEETVTAQAGMEDRIRAEVESMLGAVAEQIQADGVAVSTYPTTDKPAEAILDVAADQHADLIVVGNRGVQSRLLGSVPNNVVQQAHCSVLVVHTWPRPGS